MKLTDLEPQFLKYTPREIGLDSDIGGKGVVKEFHRIESLAEADGIVFLCPKCFEANGRQRPGVHSIICWFEGKVPEDLDPKPGRWNPTGTGYADLSFVPGAKSNSVLLLGGCAWHGFITNGEAA